MLALVSTDIPRIQHGSGAWEATHDQAKVAICSQLRAENLWSMRNRFYPKHHSGAHVSVRDNPSTSMPARSVTETMSEYSAGLNPDCVT
jgi:hypothetical protein